MIARYLHPTKQQDVPIVHSTFSSEMVAAVASTEIHSTGGHHAVHATPLSCTKQNRHISKLSA